MLPAPPHDIIRGWVSSPNNRGTGDILFSTFSTIWLCTWTSLCLHIPPDPSRHGYRALIYKFRWQLFAIFFPEVLVATAAEQWLSARQSVRTFSRLGYPQWTTRHGFFADMGGILVSPNDYRPFPVDSQQLAYLVMNKHVSMPDISVHDLKAMDRADGLARFVTLVQMTWFCVDCIARGVQHLGFCTLEVTTLAFILCTLHTFFFWYYKPLDPSSQKIIPINAEVKEYFEWHNVSAAESSKKYSLTPLDFVKPKPDAKSLITPFWFGLNVVFAHTYGESEGPVETLPNSRVIPEDGVSWPMAMYTLLFQMLYYGLYIGSAWIAAFPSRVEWYLWTVSNATDVGLIALYVLSIPIGTYYAPSMGHWMFKIEATSILDVATALPRWAKLLIHGPFVFGYIIGRAVVLTESIVSLRALPAAVYQEVNWVAFLPHL